VFSDFILFYIPETELERNGRGQGVCSFHKAKDRRALKKIGRRMRNMKG